MRVVFIGASQLGYKCCSMLIEESQVNVVGIITMPAMFTAPYSETPITNYLHANFHHLGNEHSIPMIDSNGNTAQHFEFIENLAPDLLCCIGWYHMIPKSIRLIAPQGCIGIHASLLPKYRGGAPLVWAIINGESSTGVTLFYFDDGVDNGDIIAQETITIDSTDTIADVLAKAEDVSISMLKTCMPLISAGRAPRTKQHENEATYVKQRCPADGLIDWNWPIFKLQNFIRAQTKPYPGAYTIIGNKKITIWDATIIDTE